MLARALPAAVNSMEAIFAEVEDNRGRGDRVIVVAGLPDAAAKKPRDRFVRGGS